MALEYAVHQLAGYHLLARSSPGDHGTVAELWERVSWDREQGRISSSEPDVGAVGVTLLTADGTAFFGGIPAGEDDEAEGYAAIEAPGGAYAMVTYSGSTEHISQVIEALREAVAEAGAAATGESIEVYRFSEHGELTADLGLRLADGIADG
ncbi:MAG: GyrI-like domain-containing protein [Dehalococcoidia bacterium]